MLTPVLSAAALYHSRRLLPKLAAHRVIGRGISGGEEIPFSRFSAGYGHPMVWKRPEVRIYADCQRVEHLKDDQGSRCDFAHGFAAGHGVELGDDYQHDA